MNARAALSPAEALVLWKPNQITGRAALKITLLSLLAQGALRIEEQVVKRLIGTRKVRRLRLIKVPSSPPHVVSLADVVRAAQADGGTMEAVIKRARREYGSSLDRFKRDHVVPALIARGLIERRRIPVVNFYRVTPAGDAEQTRIDSDIWKARRLPELLKTDPAQAAALALTLGASILLVNELKPYYRQISEATREHGGGVDGGDLDSGSATDAGIPAGDHVGSHLGDQLGSLHTDGFSFDAFDASAFDALDAAAASFDAGFDASDGGGDGGGGDGGGGD